MNLKEEYQKLQKQNHIMLECNKKVLKIDKNLNVVIEYTCGNKEKTPFLGLLNYPLDYHALLFGDTIFQKRLNCRKHCKRTLRNTKLKPLKSKEDLKKIWNLEHGRRGHADLTIRLATPAVEAISTEIA